MAGVGDPARSERGMARASEETSHRLVAGAHRPTERDRRLHRKAEFEKLFDKPYEDKKRVRVAGPFTVESLSPHRVLGVDENDEFIDELEKSGPDYGEKQTFPQMILENLNTSGSSRHIKKTKSRSPHLRPGQAISFAPKVATLRVTWIQALKNAPPSLSAQNSALLHVPIWWRPRAKRVMRISIC